jgi:hypothetical protein
MMACHKHVIHLPTMKQLMNGGLLYAAVEISSKMLSWLLGSQDQSQALTESGKAFTADPFEHIGVTLTGLAEELIELDDGCTETGKLEASLKRPWT